MGFAPSVSENEQERKERPPPVAAATLEPRARSQFLSGHTP
jgi:hypothetical protein